MITKKRKTRKRDIFLFVIIGAFVLLIITALVFSNTKIFKKRQRLGTKIEQLKAEIGALEARNNELKDGIAEAGSQESLERIAREQLNLKAPGEEVVVISKDEREEYEETEERSRWNPRNWWEWLKGTRD